MDAGNWTCCRLRSTACLILVASCQLSVGCSLASKVSNSSILSRSQSPDSPVAPVAPVVLPTATVPTPAVVPVTATIQTETQPTIVAAGAVRADQAVSQINVVAMIGSDVVITSDEVWQMVRQRVAGMPPDQQLTAEQQKAKERKIFEEELLNLIKRELILADFLAKIKKNKPQVLDELKDESARIASLKFRDFKIQNKITSEERLAEALQMQGMSYKVLQRQLERNAMLGLYMSTFLKDKGKGISVIEVQRYYDENPTDFKTEDSLKWLDLFVSYSRFNTPAEAQQQAAKLLKQLQSGADFVALVKEHGHGDSKLRAGEGTGNKPGEIQPAELAPTVLALKAGQLSGIIPTENGLHIVKVTEREIAGVRPFDEKVQGFIRQKLMGQIQDQERDKLIEELWRRTTVKIVELPK